MSEEALEALSDMAGEAHARIQEAHRHINPVVGVRRGMREMGIPADVMTIDCMRTRRRILLILHDQQPGALLYRFTELDEDVGEDLQHMPLGDMSTDMLFQWIEEYFSTDPTG